MGGEDEVGRREEGRVATAVGHLPLSPTTKTGSPNRAPVPGVRSTGQGGRASEPHSPGTPATAGIPTGSVVRGDVNVFEVVMVMTHTTADRFWYLGGDASSPSNMTACPI